VNYKGFCPAAAPSVSGAIIVPVIARMGLGLACILSAIALTGCSPTSKTATHRLSGPATPQVSGPPLELVSELFSSDSPIEPASRLDQCAPYDVRMQIVGPDTQTFANSVSARFAVSFSSRMGIGCGIPTIDCHAVGTATLQDRKGHSFVVVTFAVSNMSAITDYCTDLRLQETPFTVTTQALPLGRVPRGSYLLSVTLNGMSSTGPITLP
jgi:hypothetical protein